MKDTNADIIKNHIGKYIFQDGYIYTELIKGLNQQIKEIIGDDVNNNVISNNNIIINYIRMKIFDELSNNSFKNNSLFKIDKIKKIIDEYIVKTKDKKDGDLMSETMEDIFKKIQLYDDNDDLIDEIFNILSNIKNNLEYFDTLRVDNKILNVLHIIYKNTNNEKIKELYNKIKHIFCIQMSYKLNKKRKCHSYDDYDKFVTSIYTYKCHSIDHKINTDKCNSDIVKNLLNNDKDDKKKKIKKVNKNK